MSGLIAVILIALTVTMVICALLWWAIGYLLEVYSFLSKDVYQWRTYEEIIEATGIPEWLLNGFLKASIEDGELLHKAVDGATTTSDGEPLPPELIETIEKSYKTFPLTMYEYRLNPQRPRRGRGRNRLRLSVLIPSPTPQTA